MVSRIGGFFLQLRAPQETNLYSCSKVVILLSGFVLPKVNVWVLGLHVGIVPALGQSASLCKAPDVHLWPRLL